MPRSVDTPRIAELDRALELEDEDPAWSQDVDGRIRELLADAGSIAVDAQCAQTLCRVILSKPRDVTLDWFKVDERLRPVVTGETMINTEAHADGSSTAYVYFSARDTYLPLAFEMQETDGEE